MIVLISGSEDTPLVPHGPNLCELHKSLEWLDGDRYSWVRIIRGAWPVVCVGGEA